MEELLASVFSGMIIDENEKDYFVQKNGVTFRLSKKEGEFQLEQRWKVLAIKIRSRSLVSQQKFRKAVKGIMLLRQ